MLNLDNFKSLVHPRLDLQQHIVKSISKLAEVKRKDLWLSYLLVDHFDLVLDLVHEHNFKRSVPPQP
jgi:hypothetical protein